ncbi:farnesyl-diphosphate farnesyltransferase [Clavulina sp. PMI_390]|nr:farnesyl-diphosphate farnesyltransferase [Clavulina sp. PMI_390]
MGAIDYLIMLITNPNDLRTLLQFKLWYEPTRDITKPEEFATSGYDRKAMKRCWEFLDMTSRSFSMVIKQLDGDLARVIALFYLALRGLDTVEDDMTIPDEIKQPLLRSFHDKLVTPGWNYGGNGPLEKDRQLLVEFEVVVEEMLRLNPMEREVIVDITKKMEVGMADFAHKAINAPDGAYIDTQEDFDLYCHYVAGLVGEGLSRLFVATHKEADFLADELVLSNSMGLLLQKTNILRDIREDIDDARFFWPKSVYTKHGFTHPTQLRELNRRKDAMWVLSAMTLDALRHCEDALDYLTLLKTQSVFNFCAIPAVMAIATLSHCFMNSEVFDKNVKIRKAQAVDIIMKSTNPRDVAYMFRDFTRELHAKAVPSDPYFVKISIMCGKIEQWCEHHYPSFIALRTTTGGSSNVSQRPIEDARMRIVNRTKELTDKKKLDAGEAPVIRAAAAGEEDKIPWQLFAFVSAGFILVTLLSLGIVLLIQKKTNRWRRVWNTRASDKNKLIESYIPNGEVDSEVIR